MLFRLCTKIWVAEDVPKDFVLCPKSQNIGLSGPEYGDFRINNAESGKCPPEGTP
jgi:hypothetical protein